jgi:hypothetical protein
MLYLKCTGDVQKAIGLRKENLADALPSEAPLGNWYVHRFNLDRGKAYIFMSEATLLSFILFQGKKPVTAESLPGMLIAGLSQLLEMRGLPAPAIRRAIEPFSNGLYARTNSHSDLGSLTDLILHYQWAIERNGGLAQCDLTSIIMKLNEMPQRRLKWATSWDLTQSALSLKI